MSVESFISIFVTAPTAASLGLLVTFAERNKIFRLVLAPTPRPHVNTDAADTKNHCAKD
jgi:hypothetical protein